MKYRKQFLDLAMGTGIISVQNGQIAIDRFFQGNAHAVSLAAKACREAMNNPSQPILRDAGVLMAFDALTYPLLPMAAQAFRGSDCKSFVHHATYHQYGRYRHGVPTDDTFAVIGIVEDDTKLRSTNDIGFPGAVDFINQYLGTCAGAVMLFSSRFSEEKNSDIELPVLRVLREQDVLDYWEVHLDSQGRFIPYQRETLLSLD